MSIVCIGDSLTYGYGVPANDCWVNLLRSKTKDTIINKGQNGDTTSSLLYRSEEDLLQLVPDQVLLLIGTNDLLLGTDVHKLFDNICFLLNDAISNSISPIVLSPPAVYPSMARQRWSNFIDYTQVNINLYKLGQLLGDFCTSISLQFVNFYDVFMEHVDDFDELYLDGIHPSAKGHYLIYKELTKVQIFSQ